MNKPKIIIAFKSGQRLEVGEAVLGQPVEQAFMEIMKDKITKPRMCRYGRLFIVDWEEVDYILYDENSDD